MKKNHLAVFLATSAVLLLVVGLLMLWHGVSVSIRAEETLHAYYLVLDVVGQHVEQNAQWPNSWDSLVTVSPAQKYVLWSWPQDVEEIRKRVAIDFSLRIEDVAEMHEGAFDAVKQIGPHYGGNELWNRTLIATAKEASSRGATEGASELDIRSCE